MCPLTTVARDLIAKMLIGNAASSEAYANAYAQLVVGDSTGTFGSSQNDMGSSGGNRGNSSMDAGYPQIAANVLTFRSTFGTAAANFHWQEWGTKNSSASSTGTGALLQRKQEDLGTKASSQSWQLTATITVTT